MGSGKPKHGVPKDANQAEIEQAFKALLFVSYTSLHKVGGGVPDMLVGIGGRNYLVEVKTEKGQLEASQVNWHRDWAGCVHIIRSAREAQDWALSMRSNGIGKTPVVGVIS